MIQICSPKNHLDGCCDGLVCASSSGHCAKSSFHKDHICVFSPLCEFWSVCATRPTWIKDIFEKNEIFRRISWPGESPDTAGPTAKIGLVPNVPAQVSSKVRSLLVDLSTVGIVAQVHGRLSSRSGDRLLILVDCHLVECLYWFSDEANVYAWIVSFLNVKYLLGLNLFGSMQSGHRHLSHFLYIEVFKNRQFYLFCSFCFFLTRSSSLVFVCFFFIFDDLLPVSVSMSKGQLSCVSVHHHLWNSHLRNHHQEIQFHKLDKPLSLWCLWWYDVNNEEVGVQAINLKLRLWWLWWWQ